MATGAGNCTIADDRRQRGADAQRLTHGARISCKTPAAADSISTTPSSDSTSRRTSPLATVSPGFFRQRRTVLDSGLGRPAEA